MCTVHYVLRGKFPRKVAIPKDRESIWCSTLGRPLGELSVTYQPEEDGYEVASLFFRGGIMLCWLP